MFVLKSSIVDINKQITSISRGSDEIIPAEGLAAKLKAAAAAGRPLRVKLGLDPSAPDIHLGHTVVLRKLRQFQDLGHTAVLIVGDFTGMIGDPTGRTAMRPQLTEAEVKTNATTYVDQLMRILNPARTEVVFNSTWLGKMTMADTLRLTGAYTVARMLERDDFCQRYANNQPISLREFMYPLLQGYDSVAVKADIELGGTDQKFNLLVGRDLQREYGQEAQIVLTMPLLEGTDGVNKMSKSLGNYIGVTDTPEDMFGKTMSLPDELIVRYFRLVTDVSDRDVAEIDTGLKDGSLHPGETKRRLARTIVALYYDEGAAQAAEETFNVKHKVGHAGSEELAKLAEAITPDESLMRDNRIRIIDLVTDAGFAASKGEARRLVRQGAVRIDGTVVDAEDADVHLADGMLLTVGKRRAGRVTLK